MLHGCTQNPEDFAIGTQDERARGRVRPHRRLPAPAAHGQPQGCWNWFDRRHQNRGSGEPANLAGLAQALAKEFDVRRERVFAAGLSAGGAMAEILADNLPGCIRRGRDPFRPALQVSRRRALRLRRDEGNGGLHSRAASPQAIGMPARSSFMGWPTERSIPSTANACSTRSSAETSLTRSDLDWPIEGGRVSRTALKDADGRPVAEQWLVEGGGHAWFGGDPRGSYTQTVGLDASRVMVRFFLAE